MKAHYLLYSGIALLGIRIIYLLLYPSAMLWDASVYIGMGRYIESLGAIGLWEFYRPPLLPILFSLGALLGSPVSFAVFLTLSISIGALILAYKIGEHYKATAGGWASIVLASSGVFTTFTTIPTTEVFGVFGFLALYYLLVIRRSPLWGGIVGGLLVVLRFPYIIALPVCIMPFVGAAGLASKERAVLREIILYISGIGIVIIPYLFSNIALYGGALRPFTEGLVAIREVEFLYRKTVGFYWQALLITSPLCIAAVIPFFALHKYRASVRLYALFLTTITAVLYLYFTFEEHKEVRYSIHMIAPIALLAGLGIAILFSHAKTVIVRSALAVSIALLFVAGFIFSEHIEVRYTKDRTLEQYYKTFMPFRGKTVLSTTPTLAAFAPVAVIDSYRSIQDYKKTFDERKSTINYLYFNSCDLVQCQAGEDCRMQTELLIEELMDDVAFTTIARYRQCEIFAGAVR